MAAARQPGPGHGHRRRVHLHPAQHRRRAYPRHAPRLTGADMTYTWHPSPDYLENSNVARLMRTLGVSTADELRARSVADIGIFWDTVTRDLGIEFRAPYRDVVDLSGGIASPQWFPGGQLNVVDTVLSRWARQTPAVPALIHETEDGTERTVTFAELSDLVARAGAGLRQRGIGQGDAVAIYLPMSVEAVV